ncbi:hypothetical protein [Lactobacillus amylovorus]|uniref:FMN-binding protein n=1 Tax=Lactobacillus amylovorus TaxID=1604 RepID=UPI00232C0C4E|nr:hypothetical protein [Lactobacillus amylovorus]MDB6221817.1 hypothetical protein [Lactobacillus amylovorus]MDB6238571.1 hypothetical protein [Lactobacillus amylovorus]
MSLKKHFKFVDIKTSILSLYAYALGSTRSAATSCKEVIIDTLSKEFKANGANVNGIQVVSGATSSSDSMRNYASQLVQAAQRGNTATIHINNNAKYKDGTYKLETLNYDHGYHQVYTLTIKNGKIKYDRVNKKGQSKTQNASYEKQMKKYSKVGPKEYIKKLRKEFLDNDGDMEKVQVVSGATESSNDFITYVSQLLNAAQKGSMKATIFLLEI